MYNIGKHAISFQTAVKIPPMQEQIERMMIAHNCPRCLYVKTKRVLSSLLLLLLLLINHLTCVCVFIFYFVSA